MLRQSPSDGVDPEDLFELASELNYAVEVRAFRRCRRRLLRCRAAPPDPAGATAAMIVRF